MRLLVGWFPMSEDKSSLKILLVADTSPFALTDVYYGYQRALKGLNIQHEAFPYHESKELLSLKVSYHLIHSTALIKDNKFTHVMFIGGLNIPPFIYDNLYHVKSVIVATEDPHTSTPLLSNLDKIDYYFSNERAIGNDPKLEKVYYCPTAACPFECGRLPLQQLPENITVISCFWGHYTPTVLNYLSTLYHS